MHFYSPHPAFNDTIDSLKNEFKDDTSNSIIVCGVHETSQRRTVADFKKQYDKVIAFNQEPLLAKQRTFMNIWMYKFLKEADEVWDYDEMNFKAIKAIRPDTELHILKPYKNWSLFPRVSKDIDVLFYGCINNHRRVLLDALCRKYRVEVITNNFNDLDSLILRSRMLLNIHYYYEVAMQEQARMVRWVGAPCRIVSEKSWRNYLGIDELKYEEMFSI